jgi:outer membrane protein TolC
VATAFYAALLAQKQMQIAKADQDFNQAFLGDTQKRFEQGTVPRSEVLNFQIRLDNARINFIEAQSSFQIACVVLAELMGYPGADLAAQTTLVEPPITVAAVPTLAGEISAALADRPDLQRLMADLQVDRALIRARYGDFWPRVSLVSQYGLSNPDPRFSEHDQSFWYGVEGTWNLFGGGRTYYTWKQAQAQAEITEQGLRRQWQAVVSEIRQELETLRKATAKIEIQGQIVTATRTIREDVEKAYKAGQVSLTRLNEAQRDLIVADQSLAATQVQLLLVRENLAAATGANLRDVPAAP